MSELIFGPSAEPLFINGEECIQLRLDGGYEIAPIIKAGKFLLKEVIKVQASYNQPTLFDEEVIDQENPTLF